MSSLNRSVRNVFRNKARTFVVIMIIGVSIAVFLSMTIVNANIGDRTANISESLDTTIVVSAAGSFGPMNSETLPESIIPTVGSTEHVLDVQVLAMSMESESTDGTKQEFPPPDGGDRPNMRVGAMIMGENPSKDIVLFSGGSFEISSGRALGSQDTSQAVAVVGTGYSEVNSVGVDSSISLNGTAFTVVGIYTSGSDFGDNGVIIPYEVFKTTYAVDGPNTLYVRIDTVGNMDSVEVALEEVLGDDYDVTPASEMRGGDIQESIDSISANSDLGSIVSLITAAVVMIFVMVLVTRERIKEVGVMKAIGFKNSRIMSQFLTESITLASIGFVIGIIITVTAGPFISSALLGTTTTTNFGDRPGPPMGGGTSMVAQMDFTLTFDLLFYTFILAIILGVIGSLYPIIKAMRLKPAEALRYDE